MPKDSRIFWVFSVAKSSFDRSTLRFRYLFNASSAWRAAFVSGYVPRVSTRSENPLSPLILPSPMVMPATPNIWPTIIFVPRLSASFSVSWSVAAQ